MFTFDQAGRRRNLVRHEPPPPEIRPWVEHLVIDRRPALESGPWRIVPDPCAHLLASFAPGAEEHPGRLLHAIVVGARSRFVDADVTRRGLTLAVRLRPGALASLTGVPARELSDRGFPLAELFGAQGARAEEEVAGAASAEEALGALRDLVLRRTRTAAAPDWRVRAVERALSEHWLGGHAPDLVSGAVAARAGSAPSVGAVARRFGLAARTLRQVSADAVGLSPRHWLRIARLFRALDLTALGEGRSWRWVAARAGYHDPPHLTREFQALLGETPGRWLARRAAPVRTSRDGADG